MDDDADIEAAFSLKDAERFGLKVRTGAGGEETVIGYDTTTQELYVDRTRSGAVDFNSTFPGLQTAPLQARNGKVTLDRAHVRHLGSCRD